jgi:hypothetical protein
MRLLVPTCPHVPVTALLAVKWTSDRRMGRGKREGEEVRGRFLIIIHPATSSIREIWGQPYKSVILLVRYLLNHRFPQNLSSPRLCIYLLSQTADRFGNIPVFQTAS